MADLWTIAGTMIGAVSLAVAGIQTIRYQVAKHLLERITEREQVATWALYDLIIQAYEDIGEARKALRGKDQGSQGVSVAGSSNSQISSVAWTKAVEKTAQTASLLNAMWLNTIEHAATLEPRYEEATVVRWEKLGRLDTPWRVARAKKLLPTKSEMPLP